MTSKMFDDALNRLTQSPDDDDVRLFQVFKLTSTFDRCRSCVSPYLMEYASSPIALHMRV